jgi:hypothetical protein
MSEMIQAIKLIPKGNFLIAALDLAVFPVFDTNKE